MKSKLVIIGLLIFFGVVSFNFLHVPSRPHYIFINQTDRHEHDLALKMSLKIAESRSGIENGLILLKKLPENKMIKQAAEEYFQKLKIGQKHNGKGILLLYSEEENLFKIEVSYALEGVFTDIMCRQLEEAAKTYMLSESPQDFLSELLITLNIHGKDNHIELDAIKPPDWFAMQWLSGGAGISAKGYRRNLKEYKAAVQMLPVENRPDFKPSEIPSEVLERYLKSLELGLGDPQLPFLTEGSQIFRMIVPRNRAQQIRVLKYYRKAMPFKLFTNENLGLAVFRSGTPNLPIVLRHSRDGLWYIDEPKSWTYFHRFEDGNDFFPKYDDLPFLKELVSMEYPHSNQPLYPVPTPLVISYPFSLSEHIAVLEKKIEGDPANDKFYAELAELYLFEMDWTRKALELFKKAANLNPQKAEYHWRLYDLYMNDSQMEKALNELKFLAKAVSNDTRAKEWYKFYSRSYQFKRGKF